MAEPKVREVKIDYQCFKDGKTWQSGCTAFIHEAMSNKKIEQMEKDFALNLNCEKVKIISWYDRGVRK